MPKSLRPGIKLAFQHANRNANVILLNEDGFVNAHFDCGRGTGEKIILHANPDLTEIFDCGQKAVRMLSCLLVQAYSYRQV